MSNPRCGEKVEPFPKPGTPSSLDEPVSVAKPNRFACPECGKLSKSTQKWKGIAKQLIPTKSSFYS